MNDPWFRKWMWFGYIPINWRGAAVLLAMAAGFGVGVYLIIFAHRGPLLQAVGIGIFLVSQIIGNVVVLSKFERRFKR